jgi:hypothetical protein
MLPGNGLGTVPVMQVEVDNGSMRQAMTQHGVHDAHVDIVDPAEARRV